MQVTCEQCGASPAELVKSRWHLGLIVYGRTTNTQAVLCRPHARALVGADLTKTLLLGWWGVFSFLINLVLAPMQIAALVKAGQIAEPARPAPAISPVAEGEAA